MIKMQQTMRWFGQEDSISLADLKQCGISGIVTALHDVPIGKVWTIEAIQKKQQEIRAAGLEWTVIESLPVHEDIKLRTGNYQKYISNYKESLKNIGACGIAVVTYNFMPVLDWVRTEQNHLNEDGTRTLLYNQVAFAYFDIFLLKRPDAKNDYEAALVEEAEAYGGQLTKEAKELLFNNVLLGLPGSKVNFTSDQLLRQLLDYQEIDGAKLREHLVLFLEEVAPVAQEEGISLAIHPDDPPFSVLGLPRVVSTESDLAKIFNAVPIQSNGLCFCTGSLGAHATNNLGAMVVDFGDRIHFLHFRNVIKENDLIFREAPHLSGDVDMELVIQKTLELMQKRKKSIPMRPDHGFLHSVEARKKFYPGYSLVGRLKGLSELRGLEQGIAYQMNKL